MKLIYSFLFLLLTTGGAAQAEVVMKSEAKCDMIEQVTLSTNLQFGADTTEALLKKMQASDELIDSMAKKSGVKQFDMQSQRINMNMRRGSSGEPFNGSTNSSWSMDSQADATKLFKLLSAENINTTVSINKNQDRSCRK